jgi:hypothetical protein
LRGPSSPSIQHFLSLAPWQKLGRKGDAEVRRLGDLGEEGPEG